MTGKLIELGDLECLEGLPDNEKSGVVIQIDRDQLKASRNLFGEIVFVGKSEPGWKTTEPPKGENIIAVGRVIITEEICTSVEPFIAVINWSKDQSGYEGWHYSETGMTVARALDDEVKIDFWIEPPSL